MKVPVRQFRSFLGKPVEILLAAPRGQKQSYMLKVTGISSEGSRTVQVSTSDRLAMKGWWFNNPDPLKSEGYDSVTLRADDVTGAKVMVGRLRKKIQRSIHRRDPQCCQPHLFRYHRDAGSGEQRGVTGGLHWHRHTMIMSIYERTREFGTLKAMGASRGDIRQLFMMEAGLIGFGGAVGLLLSWLLGRGLNSIAIWLAHKRDFPCPTSFSSLRPFWHCKPSSSLS